MGCLNNVTSKLTDIISCAKIIKNGLEELHSNKVKRMYTTHTFWLDARYCYRKSVGLFVRLSTCHRSKRWNIPKYMRNLRQNDYVSNFRGQISLSGVCEFAPNRMSIRAFYRYQSQWPWVTLNGRHYALFHTIRQLSEPTASNLSLSYCS